MQVVRGADMHNVGLYLVKHHSPVGKDGGTGGIGVPQGQGTCLVNVDVGDDLSIVCILLQRGGMGLGNRAASDNGGA